MMQGALFNRMEYTNCEPCDYFFKKNRTATQTMGWDNAPVCDWHASHSWVTQPGCGRSMKVQVIVDKVCENELPCPDHQSEEVT